MPLLSVNKPAVNFAGAGVTTAGVKPAQPTDKDAASNMASKVGEIFRMGEISGWLKAALHVNSNRNIRYWFLFF